MAFQTYKDPTLDKVVNDDMRAKGCIACKKYQYMVDRFRCSVGKHLPGCKRERNGFVLNEG